MRANESEMYSLIKINTWVIQFHGIELKRRGKIDSLWKKIKGNLALALIQGNN